jgi:hypothetical protein
MQLLFIKSHSTSAQTSAWFDHRAKPMRQIGAPTLEPVTPGFNIKSNAHSMCAQRSSLHTYHTENGYRITNIIIYNIYYRIMSYKRLSQTVLKALQWKDTITPQTMDQG